MIRVACTRRAGHADDLQEPVWPRSIPHNAAVGSTAEPTITMQPLQTGPTDQTHREMLFDRVETTAQLLAAFPHELVRRASKRLAIGTGLGRLNPVTDCADELRVGALDVSRCNGRRWSSDALSCTGIGTSFLFITKHGGGPNGSATMRRHVSGRIV